MKRSSFNVLFFLKKTKLLKNGEASVYMRIAMVRELKTTSTRVLTRLSRVCQKNPSEAKATNHTT